MRLVIAAAVLPATQRLNGNFWSERFCWYCWLSRSEQSSVSSLKLSVSSLKSSVLSLKSSVLSLKLSVSTLKPRLMTLQPRLATLQPRLTTLQPRLTTLKPRLATLKPSLWSLKLSLWSLKLSLSTLKPRLMTLKPRLVTLKPRIVPYFKALRFEVPAVVGEHRQRSWKGLTGWDCPPSWVLTDSLRCLCISYGVFIRQLADSQSAADKKCLVQGILTCWPDRRINSSIKNDNGVKIIYKLLILCLKCCNFCMGKSNKAWLLVNIKSVSTWKTCRKTS